MATKTPSKGKKSAASDKKKSAPKAKAARPPVVDEDAKDAADDEGDDDEPKPAAAAAAPAKKPAAPRARLPEIDPPPVVPARRLTPEAKARVNEMVAKGVPLGEALRAAASWETFVAPVKEEPAKLVQGKSFDGPRPPAPKRTVDEDEADEEAPTSTDSDD